MRPGAVVQGVVVALLVHEVPLGQTSGSIQRPGSPGPVVGQRAVVVCLVIVVLIHIAGARTISGIPVIVAISVVGVVVSILSPISVIVIVIMAAVVLTPRSPGSAVSPMVSPLSMVRGPSLGLVCRVASLLLALQYTFVITSDVNK